RWDATSWGSDWDADRYSCDTTEPGRVAINRSTQRILTTHAGSLPRPDDLLELLWTRERGEAVDEQTFTGRLRDAVTDCVRVQAEHGLDIIADGEMGKASFLTYANERLSGFEPSSGSASASPFAGSKEFASVR